VICSDLATRALSKAIMIEAQTTVVREMGRLTQTPTPALDAVLALIVQRALEGRRCRAPRLTARKSVSLVPQARHADFSARAALPAGRDEIEFADGPT